MTPSDCPDPSGRSHDFGDDDDPEAELALLERQAADLERRAGEDVEVQAELALVLYERCALLTLLGRDEEASADLPRVIELSKPLAEQGDEDAVRVQALGYRRLGEELSLDEPQEALAALEYAVELWERLAEEDEEERADLADTLDSLASHLTGGPVSDLERAEQIALRALEVVGDSDPGVRVEVLMTLRVVRCRRDDPRGALEACVERRTIAEECVERGDADPLELAEALAAEGELLGDLNDLAGCLACFERAEGILERLMAEGVVGAAAQLAGVLEQHGAELNDLGGDRTGALAMHGRAIALFERVLQAETDEAEPLELASVLFNRSYVHALVGDGEAALADHQRGLEVAGDLAEADEMLQSILGAAYRNAAIALRLLGRREEALEACDQAAACFEVEVEDGDESELSYLAEARTQRALVLMDQNPEEALTLSDRAVIRLEEAVGQGWVSSAMDLARAHLARARARAALGDGGGAQASCDRAQELIQGWIDQGRSFEDLLAEVGEVRALA